MRKEIETCRICENKNLHSIIQLGHQALTGVFPKSKEQEIYSCQMELVKCDEKTGCGLVQLKASLDRAMMYGENYGYRSGLNQSMVNHLRDKVRKIMALVNLKENDLVVDIGSNDCTMLKFFPENLQLVGIDPTGKKFKQYYPERVNLIPDFFSADLLKEKFGRKKAKVVTSIAMFYDLERPLQFMKEVYDILADDGVWVFEQSYLPKMLDVNAYDTICHEHIEYYRLKQIKWMTDLVGLKILEVEFNDTNGGSFSVTAARKNAPYKEDNKTVESILAEEEGKGLNTLKPYEDFRRRVEINKVELMKLIKEINKSGEKIYGYGASTKGNVLLQYCGLSEKEVPFIAEVNEDKYGAYTPGTKIPIISEAQARTESPDYFLVLPWHFKNFIIKKETEYLKKGGKLLFPLPEPHVVVQESVK